MSKSNPDFKIKNISEGNKRLQDLMNGVVDTGNGGTEQSTPLAQNLQSYENYLSRNVPKNKKNGKKA